MNSLENKKKTFEENLTNSESNKNINERNLNYIYDQD